MLLEGMEYAWRRKVRMTRKRRSAAPMDLAHSTASFFFGFASVLSLAAAFDRAPARVWEVATVLRCVRWIRPVRGQARPAQRCGCLVGIGPYEYPTGGGCAQAARPT